MKHIAILTAWLGLAVLLAWSASWGWAIALLMLATVLASRPKKQGKLAFVLERIVALDKVRRAP